MNIYVFWFFILIFPFQGSAQISLSVEERFHLGEKIINERQTFSEEYEKKVKDYKRGLDAKYKTDFLLIHDLFDILNVYYGLEYESQIPAFLKYLNKYGFYNTRDRVNSDYNKFRNNFGAELLTIRDKGEPTIIVYTIKKEKDIANLYIHHFKSILRGVNSFYPAYLEENGKFVENRIKNDKGMWYFGSGALLYSIKINDSNIKIRAIDNIDYPMSTFCEKLSKSIYKVTSYSSDLAFNFKEGEVLNINATGRVDLGEFAGSSSPAGINGFTMYNYVNRFKHGSLIGKIGHGSWFYIGNSKRIVVPTDGKLTLKINDRDVTNNEGYYIVTLDLEKNKYKN